MQMENGELMEYPHDLSKFIRDGLNRVMCNDEINVLL